MTEAAEVIAVNAEHPDWTPRQIGEHLGCDPAYVRATAQRNKLVVPKERQRNGKGFMTLAEITERERSIEIVHRLCDPELAKAITREIRGIDAPAGAA